VPDQMSRPTLLRTIIAALTTIPSHQPIADALAELARHNLRAVEIRQLIALTEPRVFELIRAVASDPANPLDSARASALPTLNLATIERWADEVRKKAQQTADTSYLAYETIKIGEVLADLSAGLCGFIGYPATSRHAALVHRLVQRWAMHEYLLINEARIGDTETLNRFNANAEGRLWFLRTFDLNFRRRRLRFLIRCINEAYPKAASDQAALRPRLDQVKQGLYGLIRMLRNVQSSRWVEDEDERDLKEALVKLFGSQTMAPLMADAAAMPLATGAAVVEGTSAGVSSRVAQRLEERLDDYMRAHGDELKAAFTQLAAAIERQLSQYWTAQQDALSWLLEHSHLPRDLLQQMLERYIGYAYWDTVLYPLIAMSGVIEPDPVEVIRISPSDTKLLEPRGVEQRLKGVKAFHFGAFLKRSFRENDFLWGRLDGVERLLKLISDVGTRGDGTDRQESDTLVWEGFRAVLAAEAPTMHEKSSQELVTRLRAQVDSGSGIVKLTR
jgi:patatin-related protein